MIIPELNQTIVPPSARIKMPWLEPLLRLIAKELQIKGKRTLSIAFINHRTMQRLNHDYRGKNKVTDILSFAEVGAPDSLGELLLAWPYVKNQAKEEGKTLKEEYALLITHGILHLLGHDHEIKKDAKKMFFLQEKILRKFSKQY